MEPCARRLSGKRACCDLLLDHPDSIARIHAVFVGSREPSHFVPNACGVEKLRATGLTVHLPDWGEDMTREIDSLNDHLL